MERVKNFLLTQETLTAQQAHQLGGVNEVLPADRLLERAWELARQSTLTFRYTRVALTQRLKHLVNEGIGYGLALEGITATDLRSA